LKNENSGSIEEADKRENGEKQAQQRPNLPSARMIFDFRLPRRALALP
jgi:hypothetical protein